MIEAAEQSRGTINHFRIVFVGAPQAGKTSLMCAWYHFAHRIYNAKSAGDEDTTRFLDLYQQLNDEGIVDPTHRGDWIRARFICEHRQHRFELTLCDYSGEDVLTQMGEQFFSNSDAIDKHANDISKDICNADWIVLVHDPTKLVAGSAEDQHDAMWFGKLLPRLAERGRPGILKNTTVYLSRSDVVEPDKMEAARKLVHEAITEQLQAHNPPAIVNGASVVRSDQQQDRVRLPDKDTGCEVQTFFNRVMTTLISRGRTTPKSMNWEIWLAGIVLLLGVGSLIWFTWGGTSDAVTAGPQDDVLWQSQLEDFEELDKRSGKSLSYRDAQNLLTDLNEWAAGTEREFTAEYQDDGMQARVVTLRGQLESVREPDGVDGVQQRIAELWDTHGTNNRKTLFADIRQTASEAASDAGQYTSEAREEWRRVHSYCDAILRGIDVQLDTSYLTTHKWWNPLGDNSVRLEIWIVPKGDPKPFDNDTEGGASLSAEAVSPVSAGSERYTYRWRGSADAAVRKLHVEDQIWVRFFELSYDEETLASERVPRLAADGLGWFRRNNTLRVGGKRIECRVRLKSSVELSVPATIQKVFE